MVKAIERGYSSEELEGRPPSNLTKRRSKGVIEEGVRPKVYKTGRYPDQEKEDARETNNPRRGSGAIRRQYPHAGRKGIRLQQKERQEKPLENDEREIRTSTEVKRLRVIYFWRKEEKETPTSFGFRHIQKKKKKGTSPKLRNFTLPKRIGKR